MVITYPESKEIALESVCRTLPVQWQERDYRELLDELQPYVEWIHRFLKSGAEFPSHIQGSGSIAVPVADTTTPEKLFEVLGDQVRFNVQDHGEFWVTVHYPNPEPVVTLLPKALPGAPRKLLELSAECSRILGLPVGGPNGMFLAWLMPGFSWAMHTDHDNAYELIASRVHIPLITTPESLYVWGKKDEFGNELWLLTTHLEANKAHYVRVDVPHTVVNRHPTEPRLHLILDVYE